MLVRMFGAVLAGLHPCNASVVQPRVPALLIDLHPYRCCSDIHPGDVPSLAQLGFSEDTLRRANADATAAGARLQGGERRALEGMQVKLLVGFLILAGSVLFSSGDGAYTTTLDHASQSKHLRGWPTAPTQHAHPTTGVPP